MKKLFLGLTVLLLATGVVFAKGHCNIHNEDYEGRSCYQCELQKAHARGFSSGTKDAFQNKDPSANACYSYSAVPQAECVEGYIEGYQKGSSITKGDTQNQTDTTSN